MVEGGSSITLNKTNNWVGNHSPYRRSIGTTAQPSSWSSNDHGSAVNSLRSTVASGTSNQNGTSLGMAYFSGRKRLEPIPTSRAPSSNVGQGGKRDEARNTIRE